MSDQNFTLRKKIIIVLVIFFISMWIGSIFVFTGTKKDEKDSERRSEEVRPDSVESFGKIALIIDDFGYRNDEVSDGFLALDMDLTFAIIPGHEHSQSFAAKASMSGFEIIVHMPMEPAPGEEDFILSTTMTSQEIENRVTKALAEITEAIGMNNHQGSIATEDERIMNVVGSVLKKHGKYFVDSRTTRNTVGNLAMRELGIKTANRDVFLDNDNDENLINKQIDQLINKAKENGSAIGIGHARTSTLNVLRNRIPELKRSGLQFVFASRLVH